MSIEPITIERLESAQLVAAKIVVLHGPIYACLLERIDRELEAMRKQQSTVDHAHQLVALDNTGAGNLKSQSIEAPASLAAQS